MTPPPPPLRDLKEVFIPSPAGPPGWLTPLVFMASLGFSTPVPTLILTRTARSHAYAYAPVRPSPRRPVPRSEVHPDPERGVRRDALLCGGGQTAGVPWRSDTGEQMSFCERPTVASDQPLLAANRCEQPTVATDRAKLGSE